MDTVILKEYSLCNRCSKYKCISEVGSVGVKWCIALSWY